MSKVVCAECIVRDWRDDGASVAEGLDSLISVLFDAKNAHGFAKSFVVCVLLSINSNSSETHGLELRASKRRVIIESMFRLQNLRKGNELNESTYDSQIH